MLQSFGLQSAYVDSQKLGVLKMDVLEVQFDSRNHRCVNCVKTFKRPYTLRRHKISMHFGEKPFQCITCRRSFTTSDLLIYHQGTHSGEVSFDCKSCQHVKIGHQNTMRVFKCEPCNTDFDCKVHMFIYKLAYKGRYLFGIDSPDETQLDSIALNEIQ